MIKTERVNARLSKEEMERLKEISRPYGGISGWIGEMLRGGEKVVMSPGEVEGPAVVARRSPPRKTAKVTDAPAPSAKVSSYCPKCHSLERYCKCGGEG